VLYETKTKLFVILNVAPRLIKILRKGKGDVKIHAFQSCFHDMSEMNNPG